VSSYGRSPGLRDVFSQELSARTPDLFFGREIEPFTALIARAGGTLSAKQTAIANNIELTVASGPDARSRWRSASPTPVPGRERRRLPYARRRLACAVPVDTVRNRTPQRAESPVASRRHP
jgi:hypothetical protein